MSPHDGGRLGKCGAGGDHICGGDEANLFKKIAARGEILWGVWCIHRAIALTSWEVSVMLKFKISNLERKEK